MNLSKDEYQCMLCGDEWSFFPEDFERKEDYPKVCPLCTMPKIQLFKDIYKEEGFLAAIREVWKRI